LPNTHDRATPKTVDNLMRRIVFILRRALRRALIAIGV
jgi:hypothetical protein